MDLIGSLRVWCRSDQFRRKNGTVVLPGEVIMYVKYTV